ncbi:hypothetical protein DM01DRAFT_1136834 [Hesseltinella vesiculosa]|uniref:Uncharacterized protein n=1 Tax=Hesseltinella vesiculosa TaxID=101127 RepID=A0A1X2G8F8_9FUNG|nr:hypothetical protein DM01DRAFT_1136834 [Hesseltinella vesiculosa]
MESATAKSLPVQPGASKSDGSPTRLDSASTITSSTEIPSPDPMECKASADMDDHHHDLDLDENDSDDSELLNVRKCCNEHDIGSLATA